jgi:hypothetical protein
MDSPVVLPPDVAAFVQGGVSITVASRDDRLVPSIAKGVGCRVGAGAELTVFAFACAAETVARDVARHGEVAVVFSQPTTNRTVQVKGHGAAIVAAQPADAAVVRRYLALFAAELQPLGWDQHYVDALLGHDPSELLALRIVVSGLFQQTPGPGAGQAMTLPRAAGAR